MRTTIFLLFMGISSLAFCQVMTSGVTVDVQYTDTTQIANHLKVNGNMESNSISTESVNLPLDRLSFQSNDEDLYFTLKTNDSQVPFQFWMGGQGSQRHMRIGTDVSHDGDAAMEIFQNSDASIVAPGWVEVNGDLHAKKGLHLSGELYANGNIRTNNKLYFGGEDKSSYIMHIDGYVAANSSKPFNIDCKSNAFLNVKVSVGGRAAWHQGGAESNIYGYMYPEGYLYERKIFNDSPISISYRWVSTYRLEVTIHNNTGDGALMFAGTVTVSQTGWGW